MTHKDLAILIDYRPALRQRTGVGEYVHELARALVDSAPPGERLTLFSSSWKDRLPPGVIPGAETIDARVPVQVLNLAWHRLKWPPIEMLSHGAWDVVYAVHPLAIPSRSAAQVVTVHDLAFLDHPERTRREIRRDYAALAPASVKAADHVIVNSRHTASQVERRLGVSPADITVCTPGAPEWPRRDVEPASGYVLFFGTLEPRKNVGALLDAFGRLDERHRGVPLVLAGATPPEAAPLLARLGAAPLAGRVHVRGYVDPDRRLEVYQGALALVMPSHTEGFGIPTLEAMTVGVPVIAANRGALPEVVGDAGVLVDPDDPDQLVRALDQVLSDGALRDRLRHAGWARSARFSWRQSAAHAREGWMKAVERRRQRA